MAIPVWRSGIDCGEMSTMHITRTGHMYVYGIDGRQVLARTYTDTWPPQLGLPSLDEGTGMRLDDLLGEDD